jgi:hypothetical protein
MPETRRYSIEIKDVASGKAVMFTAVDWDAQDLRTAIAQNMRLAGAPDNNCFIDVVARKPDPKRGKGKLHRESWLARRNHHR